VIALFAAGVALLYAFTPSASQATSLAEAQASQHHIAYPGPPVPQYFAEALVATEDHRFYADPGVDPLALFRVTASWITGHTDGGGSTIDQQLAKNLYTSGHSSFPQIVEQVAMAMKLNETYSRPEILRLYAEVAYYGHGYYGLEAASCGYFGREPGQLTVVQAAMLAGAVNAPTYDDPLVYPARARARLVHVIDRMAALAEIAEEKGITPAQLALAWVLAQGEDIVPIPGTKRRKYLEENALAVDLKLTAEDLRRLSEVFPFGAVSGTRYPEHMMNLVNG